MSVLEAYARIIQSATSDTAASPSLTDVREVGAAIERARVVGVLDTWAAMLTDPTRRRYWVRTAELACECHLLCDGRIIAKFGGLGCATPDAARAAAAKAIESGEV